MFFNSKRTREARIQLFSFVGCLVLQKCAMGLNLICLTGKGKRKQGKEAVRCSSSSCHLAPRGRGGGGQCNGDCWYCLFCVFIVGLIGQIRYTQVAVLLLFFWSVQDSQMSISN